MTSKERLLHAIRCEPVDCVPVRIWGFDWRQEQSEPSRRRLAEIAREYGPEVMAHWGPRTEGDYRPQTENETCPCPHPGFVEDVTTIHTPKGKLTSAHLRSLEGKPGYASKHLLETPEDAEKWLSIPWSPSRVDASDWQPAIQRMGDDGVLYVGIGEPMYAINHLTGSEVWAYWLMEERELIHRLVAEEQRRHIHFVKELLAAGVVGIFGYVGPELCIPPLASPRDFDEFVVAYDKPIHDLIHDAGGLVWVHCHGRMGPVLERFAAEGVDCLNPLEPPPMGDVTIAQARKRVGKRMSFDGGIEAYEIEMRSPGEVEEKVADAICQSEGIGLILSLSTDLSHLPILSDKVLENLRTFLSTARREGQRVCA